MTSVWRTECGLAIRGRGRLRALLISVPLLLGVWCPGTAAAGSPAGSAAVSGGASGAPAVTPPASRAAAGNPFNGRGMWIWYVSQSSGGNLPAIVSTARTYGISTLMIKSGDGTTRWSQFSSQLVGALHANGLKACAWQYVYGRQPTSEAAVGAAAVKAGADCLLIDAESEYEGRYVQAQQYVRRLRQLIGTRFPVALAGFPYVDYHPAFPYSVFLGPGAAQYNAPQMYWFDIGTSVDNVYSHTYSYNTPYLRPIEPLGEVSGNPPPSQIMRFRQLSRAYGGGGVSWWDWQEASARDWLALGRPVGNLVSFRSVATLPLLSLRGAGGISAGDLVVWAQEHLSGAGQPVSIDGGFGPNTQAAVDQFQLAHGLPATGAIDAGTWQALLRYRPVAVTWTRRGTKTVATTARGGAVFAPVPWSARLRARRYEIPRDHGAGRPRA